MNVIDELIKQDTEILKGVLDSEGIKYREDVNNQICIGTLSIWMKRHKWYDSRTGVKGVGMESFMEYLTRRPSDYSQLSEYHK